MEIIDVLIVVGFSLIVLAVKMWSAAIFDVPKEYRSDRLETFLFKMTVIAFVLLFGGLTAKFIVWLCSLS